MECNAIEFEIGDDHVATITLNRPEALNSWNDEMAAEISWAWQTVRDDDAVHAAVLQANGDRAFCTGADIKSGASWFFKENVWNTFDPGLTLAPKSHHRCWKPVVTAVHGMAAGGAQYFLNESDIIIASDDAAFFDPHANGGIVSALEPIGMLARGVPLGDVLRWALMGTEERITAETALRIGLVTEVVPRAELRHRAHEIAASIAARNPVAIQGTVRAIWESLDMTRSMALQGGMSYTHIGNRPGAAPPAPPQRPAVVSLMLPADVQLVSVDDHVIEHPQVWVDRLPARYADRAPRVIEVEGGRQMWQYEDRLHPTIGLNAVAGKDPKDFGVDPVRFDEMLPGCYDVAARVSDMDLDGVYAQMCFPSFPGFAGSTFFAAQDKELAAACVSAWNDFIIDEWCAAAPGRFIPMVLVPFWDVAASVAEIERVAGKGARAISFTESPHSLGLPSYHSAHWDPMLAAAQDCDLPLCMHFGSGGVPAFAPDAPFAVAIALFATNAQFATVDLLLSPVFHKFPRLRVALSEGGIGWMPYVLERTDYTWERHRWYTGVNTEVRPSDLFPDHIFGCFITDNAGLAMRELIGVANIMFEGDYPHSDSNFPATRKTLAGSLAGVPDDQARKIAEDNARRVFNFPR